MAELFNQTIPDNDVLQHLIAPDVKSVSAVGPRGIAIQEEAGYIYVTDSFKGCIQKFSEAGDYHNHFGEQYLKCPWGILIHQDKVYVTDIAHHAIFLFLLPELMMIKRVGKKGSGNEEFNYPRQLSISPAQLLHVPDQFNNRIQILNCNLDFQDSLKHQTVMTEPFDVKFSINQMLVLSYRDNPCVHIFTLSGEKIRSIITRGDMMQVKGPRFFCIDAHDNIIISDCSADNQQVFSSEGELLHIIGGLWRTTWKV